MSGGHARLDEGSLVWPDGEMSEPQMKVVAKDGRGLWFARLKLIDDNPVDFSVGLRKINAMDVWIDIVRHCCAHRNYHKHHSHKHAKKPMVKVFWLLNTLDDVVRAMVHSQGLFINAGMEVRQWQGRVGLRR